MSIFQQTTGVKKLQALQKRIRAASGGTGASKTIGILLLLIDKYQTLPNRTGSIVSETFPHLQRGAMRDFYNILRSHHYYRVENHNRSNHIYTFETGSRLEFFAADQADKLRGGRRDDLFINEANNISLDAFNELEIRTRDTIWMDWNPTMPFWFYDEVLDKRDDVDFITLTYKDNEALEESIIKSIEARKYTNPSWYRVYGLGQMGSLEGVIYSNWSDIDGIPDEAKLVRRGLDFGYTNDESALVAVYKYNDELILDEEVYAAGLTNKQISNIILSQPKQVLVVADSAEPKSIDEIKSHGVDIIGATKGPGSVSQGIQLLQDQKLRVTKRSVNLKKAMRNYRWKIDRAGKPLNIPEHAFSHGPDSARYAITDLLSERILTTEDIFI